MHMSALTRRTQLLLDEERYRRLEREAAQTGRSVASLIREAIDARFADTGALSRRRRAAAALLDAEPAAGDREPDWAEVKDDLRGRAR